MTSLRLPSRPMTPSLKPQLRVNIPSWTVSLSTSSITPPDESSLGQWSPSMISPVSASTRNLLRYTIGTLPDHVLSPLSWKLHAHESHISKPLTLLYFVPETNVCVQITGYANGQYVVRILGQQQNSPFKSQKQEYEVPLVTVTIYACQYDGEWQDVPAWKVREKLMERVDWDRELE